MAQLTLSQAAAQIGRSPSTLRHQVQRGKLKGRLVGKTWVITQVELDRYVRDHLQAPEVRSEVSG